MGQITDLPGVTLEARDEAALEQAFGVTSNAEELVKANRDAYTPEHKALLAKPINGPLSERVQAQEEFDADVQQYGTAANAVEAAVEEKVGHPVETAVVRGRGSKAAISYTFIGPRGSIEKGSVPFTDVFGSEAQQRRASRARRTAASADPSAVGQQAADERLAEADRQVKERLAEAEKQAEQLLEDTAKQIAEARAEAEAEVQKLREEAAAEAPKVAEEAAEEAKDAETDDDAEAKTAAARGTGARRSRAAKQS